MTKPVPESIQRVLNKAPSPFCVKVSEYERWHQQQVLSKPEYRMFVKLVEHSIEDYAKALQGINSVDKSMWDNRYTLQLLFLFNTPRTLLSAHTQVNTGYYEGCLALCRIAYEATLSACFIERYPEHMWAVVGTKQPGRRQFHPSRFLTEDLKVCAEDPFYWFLSTFVHSVKSNVLGDLKQLTERKFKGFAFGFRFDDQALQMAFNNLTAITYFCIRVFSTLFNERLKDTPFAITEYSGLEQFLRDSQGKCAAIPDLTDKVLKSLK